MKFSEYRNSEWFLKRQRREAGKPKAQRASGILLVCLILALIAAFALVKFTSESQKEQAWFISLLCVCLVLIAGCLVATDVISFLYTPRGIFLDHVLAAGLILYYRELGLHPEKFMEDGVLLAEAVFPAEQEERVTRAKWGMGGEETLLDFSPLGGIEETQAPTAVLLLLLDEAERGLKVTQASVRVFYEDAVSRSEGKPLHVFKNGKLTFFAKLLRRDLRRAVKFLKKHNLEE